MDYDRKIRAIRGWAGLTMAEMAEMIGVNERTLSNYERGITIPPVDIYDQIMEIGKQNGYCR